MSRKLRVTEPGVVYHVISRFVDRAFFLTRQLERDLYVQMQTRSLRRTDWRLIAFALMSNHLHLVAVAGMRSFDRWIRPVHTGLADLINALHNRIGPVFVRGPKTFAVERARVANLLAYVHNNPVRANVVDRAASSTWTSHRAYLGQTREHSVDVQLGLSLAGISRLDFDDWVNDPTQRAERSFSEEAHELALLDGDARLVAAVPASELAQVILEATASVVGTSVDNVRGANRRSSSVLARAVAVSSSVAFNVCETDIARALDLSQQRVSVLRRQPLRVGLELAEVVTMEVRARLAARPLATGIAPSR